MVRPNWYMVEKKIKVMLQTFVFHLLFLEGQLLLWGVWEFSFSILAWQFDFFRSLLEKPKITFSEPKAETVRRQLLHGWQITPSVWHKISRLIYNFTCEITILLWQCLFHMPYFSVSRWCKGFKTVLERNTFKPKLTKRAEQEGFYQVLNC